MQRLTKTREMTSGFSLSGAMPFERRFPKPLFRQQFLSKTGKHHLVSQN
jgi:hypothetical protein